MSESYVLPQNDNGPVGQFYKKIKWDNGYEKWNLIRINTPGDKSCLFHAIANSFFVPYYTEKMGNKTISRKEIVKNMRHNFAIKLASPVSPDKNSKTYYETINNGKTAEFPKLKDLPEYDYSLKNMQRILDSDENVGHGYIEFISNALNKNIYILSSTSNSKDIYPFGKSDLLTIYKKDRPSIILYYIVDNTNDEFDHYELVGLLHDNNIIDTHFHPDHDLIKFLYNRVLQLSM
jgi:hypothetical protein